MIAPPYRHLEAAYQLQFYFVFKTHWLEPFFKGAVERNIVLGALQEICDTKEYHLLEVDVTETNLRLLLSLQPTQTISDTVRLLKTNISRKCQQLFPNIPTARSIWARGYFARSAGKIDLEKARRFIESQAKHHGYQGSWTTGLTYRNKDFHSPAFNLPHSLCMLDYHVVFGTEFRLPIFDEVIAPRLFRYVVSVGRKRGFAVERMTLLPDHMHLLLQAVPTVSIHDAALALVNNTRHWMLKYFWGNLKQLNAWGVWQPSFYAGTVGTFSTAQIREFLAA